jgi:hypothetical protein
MVQGNVIRHCRDNNGPFINSFKSMIPESVSVKVGAEAVDNILNILASSMLR